MEPVKDVDAFLRVIGGFEFCENAADERGSRRDFRFAERSDVGCRVTFNINSFLWKRLIVD